MISRKLMGSSRYISENFTGSAAYNLMPTSTEAPDGSIIFLYQVATNYNSNPADPPLQTGYTSLFVHSSSLTSGTLPYNLPWYQKIRLSWAIASTSTRAVTPPNSLASYPLQIYFSASYRSQDNANLTITPFTLGNVNFNETNAPAMALVAYPVNIYAQVTTDPDTIRDTEYAANRVTVDGIPTTSGLFQTAARIAPDSNNRVLFLAYTKLLPTTIISGSTGGTYDLLELEDLYGTGIRNIGLIQGTGPFTYGTPQYYIIQKA